MLFRSGLDACVDRLGRDFVMKYRDTSCPAYADMEDHAYCFIGVDNSDSRYDESTPVLDGGSSGVSTWPYSARCNVSYDDGQVSFLECVVP